MSSPSLRSGLAGGVFALCVVALWAHARTYLPFMVDDAFISLRYSWRLLHGQGLTWTDGERVEGYSNLLWVLLVAAGGLVQSNLVWVARTLTFAATVATFGLLLVSGLRRAGLAAVWFFAVAALSLALCGPVAAWSIGGMEQPLLVALLLAAVVASEPLLAAEVTPHSAAVLSMSLPLGLLCLLRPDGVLFTVAAVLALLCGRGPRVPTFRLIFRLVLPPAVCTLGQLAFRWFYYGDFWPNTYYAKGSFSWVRVEQGWGYIHRSLKQLRALWVGGGFALCLATFSQELRRRTWFAFFALILWLLYLVRIGGDIFPQRRHLLVVFALLAFLLLAALQWLWGRRHFVRFSALLLGPVLLAWLGAAQKRDVNRILALSDTGHWSGQPVGQFLHKVFEKQRPLLAVDAAGALPYFYQLPCLDMLGLNDRYIARHPPSDLGTGFNGHELGDGRYVLSRKPDLIAFWTPIGGERARYRSGREMVEQPTFNQLYQAITFETDDTSHTRTTLWLRRFDGRLGVQTNGDQIDVPGYLLRGTDDVVRLDEHGRLYVSLKPNHPAVVSGLRLPPGRFAVQVSADGPTIVQVLAGGRTLVLDDKDAFTLEKGAATPGDVDVQMMATSATHAFGFVLTAQSDR